MLKCSTVPQRSLLEFRVIRGAKYTGCKVCKKSASNANAGAAAETLHSGSTLHNRPVSGQCEQLELKCAVC